MKKSLRVLVGTMILGAAIAAASIGPMQTTTLGVGSAPVPTCPPDGCALSR